jgi:predicted nucleic acid-binding protein
LRQFLTYLRETNCAIAATAIVEDLILTTRNVRHFERLPELTLYQPS